MSNIKLPLRAVMTIHHHDILLVVYSVCRGEIHGVKINFDDI